MGNDHHQTLNVMHILANAYSRHGNLADAEVMQATVLRKLTTRYGEEGVATLVIMIYYAETVSKIGRHREAIELANRAMTIARKFILRDIHKF